MRSMMAQIKSCQRPIYISVVYLRQFLLQKLPFKRSNVEGKGQRFPKINL